MDALRCPPEPKDLLRWWRLEGDYPSRRTPATLPAGSEGSASCTRASPSFARVILSEVRRGVPTSLQMTGIVILSEVGDGAAAGNGVEGPAVARTGYQSAGVDKQVLRLAQEPRRSGIRHRFKQ